MKNTARRPTNRHCSVQTSATATIGGRQGPMEGARSQRPAELCRLLSAWAVVGALLVLGPAATATLFQESNIAALKAQTGQVNGDLALVEGYYSVGDLGGGWFIWQGTSANADDGGVWIIPNSNPAQGRWQRFLKGETANVKMWGAYGTIGHNDTTSIQNAVTGCSSLQSDELLFPSGNYIVTNTIVFPAILHVRGEAVGVSQISMQADLDVFRTANADTGLKTGGFGYDAYMIFENLNIQCGSGSVSNAGLVVSRPGEPTIIRNINTQFGGYGIRSLGVGAPGLKVMNSSFNDPYVAGVSIEGVVNGVVLGDNDSISLINISGDHRRANSDSTASFVRAYRAAATISVSDFKSEGSWGGGLFYYDYDAAGYPPLGSLNIRGAL